MTEVWSKDGKKKESW